MTRANQLNDLVYRLQEWRWPDALAGLREDAMFVTDADIADALKSHYGPFQCIFSTPTDYKTAKTAAIRKITFFCRNSERTLVNEAKEVFPECDVYSGTYDMASFSVCGGGYFEWKQPEQKMVEDTAKPNLTVIIAAPGSEIDYMCETMDRNGLGRPQEHLNRTVALWAAEQEDFGYIRFWDAVRKRHSLSADGKLQTVIYTDVLFDLIEQANISLLQVIKLLTKVNARVLYVTRRAKPLQAALMPQLSRKLGRSFWSLPEKDITVFEKNPPSTAEMDDWINSLVKMEATIEPLLEKLPHLKVITLEELVECPAEVMEAVVAFLGESMPSKPIVPDFMQAYKQAPSLLTHAEGYKQHLIEQLGLIVNAEGSFVAKSDILSSKTG